MENDHTKNEQHCLWKHRSTRQASVPRWRASTRSCSWSTCICARSKREQQSSGLCRREQSRSWRHHRRHDPKPSHCDLKTYRCVHMPLHACVYVCVHACRHLCMYVGMYVCGHVCIHAYIPTCIHTYVHACIHECTHTYIQAYMHAYMHA